MKATQATTYRSLQAFLDRTSNRLQTLQLQAATGKKLNRPSDDPTAISPVLSARTQIQAADRYIETIATGLDRISNMDGYLNGIGNTMIRLKEIAIAGVNGALSPADRETYASEVNQLRESLLADANASVDGKYLFAGFEEKTPPFVLNLDYDPDDPTAGPAVIYQGDTGVVEFEIAPNELITVNLAGNRLMQDPIDIFGLVTQLAAALRSDDPAAVAALIDPLEDAANQIRAERSLKGNIGRRLEIAGSQMEKIKIDMEAFRSRYEDADLIETITQLQQQEQSFQAALNVTGRVSSLSILDYI
ncbi:MAG: flagellar hook-associated protein FlgL [Desulfuromonadales bacterium]|nr:flagellar hook-associated protein FlgL [Desulfuromonadales bacterium]